MVGRVFKFSNKSVFHIFKKISFSFETFPLHLLTFFHTNDEWFPHSGNMKMPFSYPTSWWLCCWCWWWWGWWLGPPLPHCLTTPCWWWSEMYGVSRGRTTLQEKYQANYESVFRQRVIWLCALVLAKLAPSPHFFGDEMSLNATPKSQQKCGNQQ